MYCSNCGAQINDNALFCENCGASQTNAPVQPVPPIQQMPDNHNQHKKKKPNRGCLIAYLSFMFVLLFVFIITNVVVDEITEEAEQVSELNESVTYETKALEMPEETKTTGTKAKETNPKQLYDVKVNPSEITSVKNTNYLIIYYDFTNNSGSTTSFSYAFDVEIFQNGIECMSYEVWNDEYQRHQEQVKVQSGKTYRLRQAYRLHDTTSPVQYEIKDDDGIIYARGEIALQ